MSELNIYRISGFFLKNRNKIRISLDIRGVKVEDALERYYSLVGSRHFVSRKNIFVKKSDGIQIVKPADSKNTDFNELDMSGFSMPVESR